MTTPPDTDLRDLLRRADPAARLAPLDRRDFVAAVHARIEQIDTPAALRSPRLPRLLFPLAAALAILASLGAGSALAYSRGRDAESRAFAAAFARNVDPWQRHAADSAATGVDHDGHAHPTER